MKLKRISAIMLATILSATVLGGCTKRNNSNTNETSTINGSTETGSTIRILTSISGGKDDAEMVEFAETLGEAVGITVMIEKPSDYNNALLQKLQSGENYDLIAMDHKQLLALHEQGALTDLTEKVKASSILTGNIDPKEWEDIEIDGKYYAGFNKKEVFIPLAVNKTHLENAGIDIDKIEPTLEGYYEVFKVLKESNKDLKGYYPYNVILSENWNLQPWLSAEGLKGGVVIDTDGKSYVPMASDAAIPVWEWLTKLYSEDLLDPSCVVDQTKDMRAKMGAASQLTSITSDWIAWIGLHNANAEAEGLYPDSYEIVALPGAKTPDGTYIIRKGNASLWGVPINAENPEGAIKVLEYFATQEGGELLSSGIEGVDYTIENNQKVLTEIGIAHGKDHGAPFPIFKDFKAELGYNPGIEDGLQYEKYASIETPLSKEDIYKKEVIGKWAVQIVKGDISVQEGLEKMREELISNGICEK